MSDNVPSSAWLPHDPPLEELNLASAANEIRRLRGILHAILYHDERGQGIGYAEAMREAAVAIDYDGAAVRAKEIDPP